MISGEEVKDICSRKNMSFGEAIDLCRKGFKIAGGEPETKVLFDRESNCFRSKYGVWTPTQSDMICKKWNVVKDAVEQAKEYLLEYAKILEADTLFESKGKRAEEIRELVKEL